jgi:glutamate synthase domain-containing protein 1
MLVPEAWQNSADLPQAHRDMYAYLARVMEPWDGPAALADDRRALGDRRASIAMRCARCAPRAPATTC